MRSRTLKLLLTCDVRDTGEYSRGEGAVSTKNAGAKAYGFTREVKALRPQYFRRLKGGYGLHRKAGNQKMLASRLTAS